MVGVAGLVLGATACDDGTQDAGLVAGNVDGQNLQLTDGISTDVVADAAPDSAADAHADTNADADLDTSADLDADTGADIDPGGTISIYLTGDETPKTFADGLSGQTPTDYVIALSAYQVMTSAADPTPQPCFDLVDQPVEADMATDTLVGTCATAEIQTALYTHGRVRVEWARYTVEGTFHALSTAFPGAITAFRAYSETTYEGTLYPANTGWIRFSGVTETVIPWTYPAVPAVGGVRVDLVDSEAWMSFPYTRPLLVDATSTEAHWARFHWEIKDAFRWADLPLAGYGAGVWDLAQIPSAIETVLMYGVSGYHVTASTD